MTTTHRTRRGAWAVCDAPENCPLKFHLPDTTVAEMRRLPFQALLPLLEVFDPPTEVKANGVKIWYQPATESYPRRIHRDYDLPAVINPRNGLFWYRNDLPHRGEDRPASIDTDGTLQWWRNGRIHREGGKPAVILPDGTEQVWVNGGYTIEEES